jgi:two-component system response regulator TtrR
VVDDNAGVRNSLRALMESAGIAVETYASSEEFLDAYNPEQPGCLVLDVRLRAGASGLDLQDELRRRNAVLPIIVLTGHGNVPTVRTRAEGGSPRLPTKARTAKGAGRTNSRCHRGRSACA